MHSAIDRNNLEVIQILLNAGVDLRIKNQVRWTPLCKQCIKVV